MKPKEILFSCFSILLIFSVFNCSKQPCVIRPERENFDTAIDGKKIGLYELKNKNGIEIYLTNYGARIVSIITPDINGNKADIVLGFNTIGEYLKDSYTGPVVGRFANRISAKPVIIDGNEYLFSPGKYPILHGGKSGFNRKIWDAVQDKNSVTMTYTSPDSEEKFPGTLKTEIIYTLTDNDELIIEYTATTDKTTIINLSNHSYFNLKGEGDSTILDHVMQINADYITPVDTALIPTGEFMPVENTPFDFRNGMFICKMINIPNEQLTFGLGYDHNWVLKKDSDELSFAVKLSEKTTGRTMTIYTTEPGVQFYCGSFMNGKQTGKSNRPYMYRSALVLEPQHFPDSPHYDNFPSTLLRPGKTYRHRDVYKFSVEK